jgi:hypothetical protein
VLNYNRFDIGYERFPFIQCPWLTDLLLITYFLERRSLYIDTALTSHPCWWAGQVGSAWPCGRRLYSHQCSRHLSALRAVRSSHSFVPANSDTIPSESVNVVKIKCPSSSHEMSTVFQMCPIPVFLNRRAAARYQALASIIPGREKFSWNLSF